MVSDFNNYMEMIETTVDMSLVDMNEYVIKAEFDEDLRECKENMDHVTSQFDSVLKKAAKDLGLEAGKTVKLDSNSQLGHYFRITLKVDNTKNNFLPFMSKIILYHFNQIFSNFRKKRLFVTTRNSSPWKHGKMVSVSPTPL